MSLMLPQISTAYPHDVEDGRGSVYLASSASDPVRVLVVLQDGRAISTSIHGLVQGECFYLDFPDNPRPW